MSTNAAGYASRMKLHLVFFFYSVFKSDTISLGCHIKILQKEDISGITFLRENVVIFAETWRIRRWLDMYFHKKLHNTSTLATMLL